MRITQDPLSSPVLLQSYVYFENDSIGRGLGVFWHRLLHFFTTGTWMNHATIIDSLQKRVLDFLGERASNVGRKVAEEEWNGYTRVLQGAKLSPRQREKLQEVNTLAHQVLFEMRSPYAISLNHFEERFGLELPDDFQDMPGLLAARKQEFLAGLVARNLLNEKWPRNPHDALPEEVLFVGEMNQHLHEARRRRL